MSLAVADTDALRALQHEVCAAYRCLPRPELHVTVGYLGCCERRVANAIAAELSLLAPTALCVLETDGVGGAVRDPDGQSRPIAPDGAFDPAQPRVLWLAVRLTNELLTFRNAFIAVATIVGADTSYIRPTFWPHVTLGSAGPDDGADWSGFDLHDVPKIATLNAVHISVNIKALHITSTTTAPDGIITLRSFDHE